MAVKTKTKAAKAAKTPRDGGKTAAKAAQKDGNAPRTVRLGQFREDPDNVSVATDEEIARLAGKLKRVPLGLTAMRIAYVTDAPGGGCMVVSGNKRLRCLKAAYGEDGEVPAEWFQDITAMSEAERHEFRLNANISDGHFDLDKLLAQYDTAELSEAGLDELLADLPDTGAVDGQTDADAVPEVDEEPKSRRGEVYQCGEHRLMCGDATSAEDVARLMCGERASVFVFDPPYEMPEMYDLIPRNDGGALLCFSDHKHFAEPITAAIRSGWTPRFELVWDCVQSWFTPNRPLARHKTCTVYGEREDWDFDAAVIRDGKRRESHTVHNTRGKCDYVPLDGAVHLRTVEAFANTAQNDENGYGKPVEWVSAILNGYAPSGCIVIDMFCGSGSFIIACEKTGRVCYGMELDPHYCDVIRRRWAEFVHGEGCDWERLTPNVDA